MVFQPVCRIGDAVHTNRLRTDGTDALFAVSRVAGARRFVAKGFVAHRFERQGSMVKTDDAQLQSGERAAAARHRAHYAPREWATRIAFL